MRVQHRHIVYVGGYDPRGLAQYFRMFRTELRKFARLYGIAATTTRPQAADSGEIGAIARLRAAWIMAASAPRAELETLLAPLNTEDSAWQPLAREILAFSDYRGAKPKQAAEAYRALSEDPKSPEGLRVRARAMATFLDNGAGSDFGTVPAAPAPPALPAALPAAAPLPLPAPA